MVRYGNQIKKLRKEKGWTQDELGKRAGVNQRTISQIELNKGTSLATLTLLAEALGTNLADLLKEDKE